MVVQVGHADLFGDAPTRLLAHQPALFKHTPHFDLHNQHTIILELKRKQIKIWFDSQKEP